MYEWERTFAPWRDMCCQIRAVEIFVHLQKKTIFFQYPIVCVLYLSCVCEFPLWYFFAFVAILNRHTKEQQNKPKTLSDSRLFQMHITTVDGCSECEHLLFSVHVHMNVSLLKIMVYVRFLVQM